MTAKQEATPDLKSVKSADKKEKDYGKYFQAPSLKDAKKRGKEEISVHYDFAIPEEMKEIGKGHHYLIRTFGCQMNEHDTETMAGILEAMGYTATEDELEASVVLFNTCAIREGAEDKVFGELGHMKRIKRNNPNLILGLCGCMSQEEKVVSRVLKTYDQVDMIFGTHNIHRLPVLLRDAMFSKEIVVEVWSKEGDIIENMPKTRTGDTKAWVNIMYGCDKFCTYCIVPYTRGKERSRLPEDVIAEVRELARQGFKEVMLLGQNVNAYGKDIEGRKYGLGDLMDELRKIDIPRIRFTTSHPRDFDDHLIEVLAKRGNLVEQIHLPVQSGSSEVLKKMARKYTREHYMELVRKIKAAIPDVSLTTDIIVGFPGETEEQFLETLSLFKEVEYDSAYTFMYSPREGTPAAVMADSVPEEVKKSRLHRLMEVQNEISLKKHQEMLGQTYELLVESESRKNSEVLIGRTRTGKLVHVKADNSLIGKLVHVTITDAKTFTLYGELVTKVEV
ncbi:tRNA (N6-isopentenyl adenosine(37)-C2)-methylthiotransferase MiaB [Brevibacillus daliensis]|uniref:tRNA (N6-isopentenyl adenosine(37)-C2)-methylthiotransferase MiaB n=1 Tax=Brevibacillus daliensis TaxID=2892995 RepID=UPI001E635F85|nr:tRNA (N6-isopentenyl adenosine(37)-C2)-methylthiotransferase MiaB [Brevibacillus daliensis]